MKLGLGTVQFGMPYGISNRHGQPKEHDVRAMLAVAQQAGITVLDTAHAYGSSEQRLGTLRDLAWPVKIVTKTPVINGPVTQGHSAQIQEALQQSLRLLRTKKVYGLLAHQATMLLDQNGSLVWNAMMHLKQQGLVEKIGVSVYAPAELAAILDLFPIELVQLPLNVFDQRFLQTGMIDKLTRCGIEIHVRSVFLQGLLVMPQQEIGVKFNPWRRLLDLYHKTVREQEISLQQAALAFVSGIHDINHIIVGVNNVQELIEIIAMYDKPHPDLDFTMFACNDERIVNPSQWKYL